MFEGFIGTGFASMGTQALTGSWQPFELIGSKEVGSNALSRTVNKFLYINLDLDTIATGVNQPSEVAFMLTWDQGGDHYIFTGMLQESIETGQTTATDGTVHVNFPESFNCVHPPKEIVTYNTSTLSDRTCKAYLWVKLIGGTTPTANGKVRVGFHHGGV